MGGDKNQWHGRSRCLPPCPLGGGWWGHRSLCRSGSCVPTTGGPEAVAWQPSGLRGHASATPHQRCRDRSAGGCADRSAAGRVASPPLPTRPARQRLGVRQPPRDRRGRGATLPPVRCSASSAAVWGTTDGVGRTQTWAHLAPDSALGRTRLGGGETAWPGTSNTPMSSRRGGTS